ncbi:uncharacterized protein EV154DRAFT_495006 [Mucor mucedo]|uniref:uncharacterized protein n=1 Tax=Mucor mucedo TaxID=29922 RepID=UPI00222075C1|nr:uncharacterized protein EV154DRAFT_495006 [Mucor mucedo]KAI7895464.1 hypothetical protein EV154DRAFT_495006 [Mucor mucedo]
MSLTSLPYEIVHCSSFDDDYSPEQLAKSSPGNQLDSIPVKCKGWQTPKCPEYPQDLIIHLLSGTARISKVQILSHHFKIATKIDVYIGLLKDAKDILDDIAPDTPPSDDEDNMLIEFTRLGYVCFDNNARAQFRARELKSIKINSDGEYVRLVIRNCHRNRLNTFNQVGILALNILGQPLHLVDKANIVPSSSSQNHIVRHPFDDNSILSTSTRRTSVSSNQSSLNRLSSASGFEIELGQWTSALIHAEEDAVRSELYQTAKTYKYLGEKMEKFTKILSDLEIGKRHAVETKDYDEAEKIKDDIKEIKQAAQTMLKGAHVQITSEGNVIPLDIPENIPHSHSQQQQQQQQQYQQQQQQQQQQYEQQQQQHEQQEEEHHHYHVQEDTVIGSEEPTMIPSIIPIIEDPESIPEPIMDEERGPYTIAIQVFGEDIVACVLSMKAKCRTRGLGLIEQRIESVQSLARDNQLDDLCTMIYFDQQNHAPYHNMNDDDDDDEEEEDEMALDTVTRSISNFINATLMMIQEAVMDSREPIVSLAITTWHHLNDFCRETGIDPRWTIEWIERTFSGLLKRTGDTNLKIKTAATLLISVLVQSYPSPPFSLMPLFICKPERLIHNYKEAKSRVELVEALVVKLGVEKSVHNQCKVSVPLQDLMAFVVAYLNHGHDDVRQAAVKLVVTISEQIGFNIVSSYIDETLRVSLAGTVQKLVDKGSFHTPAPILTNKIKKTPTTKETQAELRKAAVQPERKTRSSNRSVKETTDKKSTRTNKSGSRPTTARSKPIKEPVNENDACIFCEEVNAEFNEDTLIKHYYNTCPVLTNCSLCQIVTEISTLNEHMLVDCERHHLVKACPKCRQAIPVEQWHQHTMKGGCKLKTGEYDARCPLCLVNILPANDAGWKLHLMTGEGCTKLKRSRAPKKKMKKTI